MKMRGNILNILSLASLALFNTKKVVAIDEFLANTDRPEFFEITDFNIPKIYVDLPAEDFDGFVLASDCARDCNPEFMRRNEKCYTAPWVDLNNALKISIDKKYLDYEAIKKNSKDYQLVQQVIDQKTHEITLSEFEKLVKTYSDFTLEKIMTFNYGLYKFPGADLNSKNASMRFELDGNVETVEKIKVAVGGRSTRSYSKLGYNINIKGDKDFHGIKQIRLRSEVVDPTFIRDKLGYDLYNIIGLPSLSANYAHLYFNDVFMGLFLVRDAFKAHWVQETFGEANTTHLYSCDGKYGDNVFFNCRNDDHEDDDTYVDEDWNKFLDQLEKSKTRADLEKFFDVDTYMKWQVSRYIFGSWDHVSRTHNNVVYMYHSEEKDLWIPLLYDFDLNFGSRNIINAKRTFNEEVVNKESVNPLYKILNIDENSQEVRDIMQDIINKAFDPRIILSRIDQLRDFLMPYVLEDRTPDENGRRPGRLDRNIVNAEDNFNFEHFILNSEFTTINTVYDTGEYKYEGFIYGALKGWIIERFKFACSQYSLDCKFAEDFMESPYIKDYKAETINVEVKPGGCKGSGYACCIFEDTPVLSRDSTGAWGVEGGQWCLFKQDPSSSNDDSFKDHDPDNCWSKSQGYECCTKPTTTVYTTDDAGYMWGIEHNEWCGITSAQCPNYSSLYKCCKSCDVKYADNSSYWGIENGEWCSIPYTCRIKKE